MRIFKGIKKSVTVSMFSTMCVVLTFGITGPASAEVSSTVVRKSAPCAKATKDLAAAKKALFVAMRKPHNARGVKNAEIRYQKARKKKTAACKVTAKSPEVTGAIREFGTANTFSGYPYDPRPVNWVKPADGSGLPGSNVPQVTNVNNCPVAVHNVEFKTSDRTGQVTAIARYTNNAPMYVKASIVDVVDNNGNPVYNMMKIVDGGLQSGSWPMLEAVVDDGTSLHGPTYDGSWVGGPSVTAKNGTKVAKVTVTCLGYAAWGGQAFKPWNTLTPAIVSNIVKEKTT
ncbi:MAG: hypothetical protein PHN51_07640 [Candidatus Nanopelagicales bacterium]|nr:hypothetical protein [Candidatus Nanopelagicales bacterium]